MTNASLLEAYLRLAYLSPIFLKFLGSKQPSLLAELVREYSPLVPKNPKSSLVLGSLIHE